MKTKITVVCATLLLAAVVGLRAEEAPKPKPGSAEFERMKSLVGTWKGNVDMGQGPVEMVSQYRLLAGGTVLEERRPASVWRRPSPVAGRRCWSRRPTDRAPLPGPWSQSRATVVAVSNIPRRSGGSIMDVGQLKFDAQGLITAVVQDWRDEIGRASCRERV